ncbi:MAG: hypothetical protein SFU25_03315 [Candidatus Caenarcaniphilales bacterium]|nr:hypothetical protein [Candidatus Caenarcaniphilales bacterium]
MATVEATSTATSRVIRTDGTTRPVNVPLSRSTTEQPMAVTPSTLNQLGRDAFSTSGNNVQDRTTGFVRPSGGGNYNLMYNPFDLAVKMLREPQGIHELFRQIDEAYASTGGTGVTVDGAPTVIRKLDVTSNSDIPPRSAEAGGEANNLLLTQYSKVLDTLESMRTLGGAWFAAQYNQEAQSRGMGETLTTEQAQALVDTALSQNGNGVLVAVRQKIASLKGITELGEGKKTISENFSKGITEMRNQAYGGGGAQAGR